MVAFNSKFGCLLCLGIVLYLLTFAYALVQVSVGRGIHQHDKCDQPKKYLVTLKEWLAIQGFVNCGMIVCFLVNIALYRTFKRLVVLSIAMAIVILYTLWLVAWVPTGFIQLIVYSHECIKMEHALYIFTYASLFVGLLLIVINPLLAYFVVRFMRAPPADSERASIIGVSVETSPLLDSATVSPFRNK